MNDDYDEDRGWAFNNAVQLGVKGEDPEETLKRANAFYKWLKKPEKKKDNVLSLKVVDE